jgi:hypothetical protein
MMKRAIYYYLFYAMLLVYGCRKPLDFVATSDGWREGTEQLSSFEGIMEAVNGNYILLRKSNEDFHMFSELRGNTIDMAPTVLQYFNVFDYVQDPGLPSIEAYWINAYALVIACNKVLEGMARFEQDPQFVNLSPARRASLLYAKGETLFLRAYTYFNLVRLFGRPYYQRPQVNPGVMIKNNTDINFIPGRSTVKETYAQVIEDLMSADSAMTADVGRMNVFASRTAVWALLSRVYLYMGGTFDAADKAANQQVLLYADKVIRQGKFRLLEGNAYDTLYHSEYGNPEIIFASANKDQSIYTPGWLLSMGWEVASSFWQAFMPDDHRRVFFKKVLPGQRLVTAKYEGIATPFIHLRLAEVYLNKAEALLKMDSVAQALDALNVIHTRAGLPALADSGRRQLQKDIILERRLELCFEGHAGFDDYRNGLPMIRPAIGTGAIFEVLPTDKRVVLPIPQREMDANPHMVQNE